MIRVFRAPRLVPRKTWTSAGGYPVRNLNLICTLRHWSENDQDSEGFNGSPVISCDRPSGSFLSRQLNHNRSHRYVVLHRSAETRTCSWPFAKSTRKWWKRFNVAFQLGGSVLGKQVFGVCDQDGHSMSSHSCAQWQP